MSRSQATLPQLGEASSQSVHVLNLQREVQEPHHESFYWCGISRTYVSLMIRVWKPYNASFNLACSERMSCNVSSTWCRISKSYAEGPPFGGRCLGHNLCIFLGAESGRHRIRPQLSVRILSHISLTWYELCGSHTTSFQLGVRCLEAIWHP